MAQGSAGALISEPAHAGNNAIVQIGHGFGRPALSSFRTQSLARTTRRAPTLAALRSDTGNRRIPAKSTLEQLRLGTRYHSFLTGTPSGRSPPPAAIAAL